jgi:hypothetical protein
MREGLRGAQAGVLKQGAEFQQGCHAQARLRCVLHLAAGKGVEHPGGESNLEAIGEGDDDTVRGLSPQPPDNLHGLSEEGMV